MKTFNKLSCFVYDREFIAVCTVILLMGGMTTFAVVQDVTAAYNFPFLICAVLLAVLTATLLQGARLHKRSQLQQDQFEQYRMILKNLDGK